MNLLWEHGRLTARQIRELLYPKSTKPQHGTVQRFLQSLEDKHYVERDKNLSVHLFSAVVNRETYAGLQLKVLADKLTGGSIAPFITHLLGDNKIDRAELARLRQIIDDALEDQDRS